MANVLAPFGFRLLGISGGSVPATFGTITRKVASNASAIFRGDPVEALSTGYIQRWGATDSNLMAGIFDGCKYFSTSQKKIVWSPYWPGSDATGDVEAYLIPCAGSPAPQFVVQVATTALAFADIGSGHAVTIGTGNTTTGQSGAMLTSAQVDTQYVAFIMTGLWSDSAAPNSNGTDNASANNWVIVRANTYNNTGV